jgi:hypothetical protein
MDWLRSEDLKEEKVVTTPAATITRQKVVCSFCPTLTWRPVRPVTLWQLRVKRNQETLGQERSLPNSSRK